MGLGSVTHTAASGLSAAEMIVAAVANNLANARTDGYKASRPVLATQQPQTFSPGRAPSSTSGGTNPMQVGLGVMVGAMATDFSQGQIATTSDPLQLAISGDGFFVLEGAGGQRFYTRDGHFSLNADRDLVTSEGYRVLGFAADDQFELQTDELRSLRIPVELSVAAQEGGTASLVGFSIQQDGQIMGRFTDGRWCTLGQIRLARFASPNGLAKSSGNRYAQGVNSGLPVETAPQQHGAGSVVAGATELANTDIAEGLLDLTAASNLFRASLLTMDTAANLLDELVDLRRVE